MVAVALSGHADGLGTAQLVLVGLTLAIWGSAAVLALRLALTMSCGGCGSNPRRGAAACTSCHGHVIEVVGLQV
jgi:hypothetical protein